MKEHVVKITDDAQQDITEVLDNVFAPKRIRLKNTINKTIYNTIRYTPRGISPNINILGDQRLVDLEVRAWPIENGNYLIFYIVVDEVVYILAFEAAKQEHTKSLLRRV